MDCTDGFTELNLGDGGNFMDETIVSFPGSPTERRRERIQIGGCDSDELVDVRDAEPASTDFGLVVRPIGSIGVTLPGPEVCNFGTVTLVGVTTESTISSLIIPAGKTFHGVGWVASADVNAIFRFYIDGTLLMTARSTVSQQTVQMEFFMASPTGTAGQTVKVTGEHFAGGGILAEFESTILGYLT